MIKDSILETIGHTPVIVYEKRNGCTLYLKLEMFNPGMSVKDRVAYQMILDLEKKGLIDKNTKLVEGTSGNTGIGLALVCAAKGISLTIVMPENMSKERIDLMKAYGATVILTPKAEGMAGAEKRASKMSEEGYLFLNQFENRSNTEAHRLTTVPEITEDFPKGLDYFVAGVGTSGTITGVAQGLRERGFKTTIVAVEPAESEVLEGSKPGPHGIQGIGANFVPPLYDKALVDEIVPVETAAAVNKVNALARKGLFLGISSGAAIVAGEKIAAKVKGKSILVLCPDGGIKYMSMGIYGSKQ
jgi:cysteine synthase